MSFHETAPGAPAADTHALLQHLAKLAGLTNSADLLDGAVAAVAQLSGCALNQLYLMDASQTALNLAAQWLDGEYQPRTADSRPRNYYNEALLQFCLSQQQPLTIPALNCGLYQSAFLPQAGRDWSCLLCLPLQDSHHAIHGLLLVADRRTKDMQQITEPLSHLGQFILAQLGTLYQLTASASRAQPHSSCPAAGSDKYGLLGSSPAIKHVQHLISRVLTCPVSVLITGETGTGKELVARAVHNGSSRRNKPLVVQNCASLPESLLESELFGYRRGAFTGADAHREGLFDAANGGTLFLDEIGDMQLPLQGKLLRVLQEGEVRPLGSSKTHKVDVRIIAATHHNLQALVAAGKFRADLFYRLAGFPIELPPLRERSQDIIQLARHFTDGFCRSLQRLPCDWSETARQWLLSQPFPGNVRELKASVERAVLLCESNLLLPVHFDPRSEEQPAPAPMNLRLRLDQLERDMLLDCLQRNKGNQSQSARELELSRRTFLNRLERLGIKPADQAFMWAKE